MAIKVPIIFEGSGDEKVGKSFDTLSTKLTALATSYLALDRLFEKTKEAFKILANYALENEAAASKLKTTLEIMGLRVDKNFESIRRFSEEMQKFSGVQDESIMQVTATNLALGLTIKQAEAMTQAALGLSKAEGVDLVTANKELIASLNGQVGGLKDVSKEVLAFNKVQLAHGAAIDLISEKFNKFITSDISTTGGALTRLKVSFEDLIETVGVAFFEGLDIPGHFKEINELLQEMAFYINQNKETYMEWGRFFGDAFIPALRTMASMFSDLANIVVGFGRVIYNSVIEPFHIMYSWVGKLKSLATGDKSWEQDALSKIADDQEGAAAGRAQMMDPFTGQATESDMSAIAGGTTGKTAPKNRFGKANLPLNRELIEMQAALQKMLNVEILSIEAIGTNQLVAEYKDRVAKLDQIEKDAARKGFDFHAQIVKAKELLDEKYAVKFRDKSLQDRIDAATASGETIRVIELQYRQEIEALEKKLKTKEILENEYNKAVIEARRKADKASDQTTGSSKTDDLISTATGFVNSIQGGINSIIGQVGQMFGPYGTLIAGIIQLLNMTKEQFKAMIDGLIDAAAQLPKNIADNIPEIVRKIPESLAATIAWSFDVHFWTDVVRSLWTALKDMFHNFWALLFGGDLAGQAKQAQQKVAFKGFGADDPNAGNGEFKIKDIDLRNQRRAGNFEDTFKDTVETAQKGFFDYLKEAWDNVIRMLTDFFAKVPKMIWEGLMDGIGFLVEWGKKIWEGLWSSMKGAWNSVMDLFGSIGMAIWNTLKSYFNIKLLFGDPAQYFENLGNSIWTGLKKGLDSLSKFFTDMFDKLNPASLIQKIFKFDDPKPGKVETALGINIPIVTFATGGMVPGDAPMPGDHPMNDRVLAYLSPGEAVIPRSLMSNPNIAGLVGQLLNAPHFWLGNDIVKTVEKAGGDTANAAKTAGGQAADVYKEIQDLILNPLWNQVWPQVQKMVMKGFESNKFHRGGIVGYSNGGIIGGNVQRYAGGGVVSSGSSGSGIGRLNMPPVYNFTFNVSSGANFDRDAVKKIMPEVIETLRRESRNGTYVIKQNGVRG